MSSETGAAETLALRNQVYADTHLSLPCLVKENGCHVLSHGKLEEEKG